jgi:sulfonate transport system substrate-binding protein
MEHSAPPPRPRRGPFTVITAILAAFTASFALAACGADDKGPHLALTAAVPDEVPDGTVLRIGDPATQVALETSGLIDDLDVDVEWANISGGPKTLEAFRADAIDVGAVADIPPLFAQWTGTDIKIVAARETVDPLEHPTYELGVAPGVDVHDLSDLAGKKIAYSPGQAQGALVLRTLQQAGLSESDVDLVEMTSVDDSYVNALASKQVDVAPLGQTLVKTYLAKYERDGASTIPTGIRDDAWTLYAPTSVIEDANKAAALKKYVAVWAKAQEWINEHPDEFAKAYYVDHEGLSQEDAEYVVKALGTFTVPTNWDDFIQREQQTADLLAEKQDHEKLDVPSLFDRRYEKAIAQAAETTGTAS